MATSGKLFPEALGTCYGNKHFIVVSLGIFDLTELAASLNGIIFEAGRAVFALSLAGYIPKFLSLVSKRSHTLYVTIIINGIVDNELYKFR
ncbi:hypothetical protein [Carboxydothermus ferrireducens]|uniref:Ethanolamine permease n=1 Tax=Carboxydothermus ferrireducens DSM 11255 TaxID=1119529 RepID=A0ABX2RF71_9THEO|nr:hypothetical protein [Carboxydothermus ferrireducens]NYE58495.1 ethanolamine permease [Carboxydothermus ferrireducens DSM 11255]